MKKMKMASFAAALTAFALTACSVGDGSVEDRAIDQRAASIVNGELEDGFPAIGVLMYYDRDNHVIDYISCSATLIRSNWVLSAAHCFDTESEAPTLAFFMDPHPLQTDDVDWNGPYEVPDGVPFYTVKRLIKHPSYDLNTATGADIALLELDESVPDVDPMPIFAGDLHDYIGTMTKSVGYGITLATQSAIDRRKRSVDLKLEDVFDVQYYTSGEDKGVCYGDSGGPNLVNVDGEWQIAGIHAVMFSWDSTWNVDGTDTCLADTGNTNVESLRAWIHQQLGEAGNCNDDPDLCHCAEACQPDGLCEPYRCSGSKHCLDMMVNTPTTREEVNTFWINTMNLTPESVDLYVRYNQCSQRYQSSDSAWLRNCLGIALDCIEDGYEATDGTLSCRETVDCINRCGSSDYYCANDCLYQAQSDQEVHAYRNYLCAYYSNCALDPDDNCFKRYCQAEFDACDGPAETDGGIIGDPDGGSDADVTDGGMEDAEPDAEADASETDAVADAGEEDASETDAMADAGEEDASETDAMADAGDDAGSADASDDTSTATEDSGASADSGSDDAAKPSEKDADLEEEDDDDGDDGCSAMPGTQSRGWLAFIGLSLLVGGRRKRTRI